MEDETRNGGDMPFVEPATLLEDPHGIMRRMRDEAPVFRTDAHRVNVLHARNVTTLATDPRTVQIPGAQYVKVMGIPQGRAAAFLCSFFLLANGEEHTRRRGPFARTFSHPAMKAKRAQVRDTAERIMAAMPRGAVFDFVDRVAARVPAEMIADILGLPRQDAGEFARMVYAVSATLSPPYAIDRHDEIEAAAEELFQYVSRHLDQRRRAPGDDLLSTLVADEGASTMEPDELTYQVMGVILGGSDTTRSAFAMLVALLLQRPKDWAAVKADPGLIPAAVVESLRYEPSVGSYPRFLAAPAEIDGVSVPPGCLLALTTMSAMRDPDLYADPDRFDIRRDDHPRLHPVFGAGAHRCLGEMLARIEMEEALAALIAAAPDIRLSGEPPRMLGYGGLRRITPMPVRIG